MISLEEAHRELWQDYTKAFLYDPCEKRCEMLRAPEIENGELALFSERLLLSQNHREIYKSTGVRSKAWVIDVMSKSPWNEPLYLLRDRIACVERNDTILLVNRHSMAHTLSIVRSFRISYHLHQKDYIELAQAYGAFAIGGLQANFIVHAEELPPMGAKRAGNVHRSHVAAL